MGKLSDAKAARARELVKAEAEASEKVAELKWRPATRKQFASWKDYLRELVGPNGERLLDGMLDIAEGRPWIPRLHNGREGEPVVPTTADRLAAQQYLSNMLHGRPVDQTKVMKAEREASKNAEVIALSDEDLRKEIEVFYRAGVLGAGHVPTPNEILDAGVAALEAPSGDKDD